MHTPGPPTPPTPPPPPPRPRWRLLAALAWIGVTGGLAQVTLAHLIGDDLAPASGPHLTLLMAAFMAQVFLFHAGLAMLPVLALAAGTRRWWLGALALIVAGAGLGPELPALLRPSPAPAQPGDLRIISINALYGRADTARLLALVDREKPDVLLVQEWTGPMHAALDTPLRERFAFADAVVRDDAFGQAVFSRTRPTEPVRRYPPGGFSEPQITLTLDHRGVPARITNIHLLPPIGARMFAEQRTMAGKLVRWIDARDDRLPAPDALIGDFNATDRTALLATFFARGYSDAHRAAGSGRGSTWPRAGTLRHAPGIGIDRALVGPRWQVVECRVGEPIGSDHLPLIVTLRPR